MKFERRDFLRTAGLATVAGIVPGLVSCNNSSNQEAQEEPRQEPDQNSLTAGSDSWEGVRASFQFDPATIQMAGFYLASHPTPVREAISSYRRNFNENPAEYVQDNFSDLPEQIRNSAASYMNVEPNQIALTDSTTMGTALVINGLHIREDQEMLTAELDYYSTHKSIEFKARQSGASSRKIAISRGLPDVTEDEIVDRYMSEIRPNTRLLTGTWVHSSTGLKIPVRKIADRLAEVNAQRSPEDRVIFFIDGVHGLGVEDTSVRDLGCDFFSAGTHKWMFGPRGTGILWGNSRVQNQVSPTIPTFTNGAGWGGRMTPGGFKAFEHQWAMREAFEFHGEIGKERVRERIHSLARHLKEGLKDMEHVTLYTPIEQRLSSGIICFDVNGMSPHQVVNRLQDKNITASTTPYDRTHARIAPGIYNTREEIEEVLRAVRDLG